MSENAAREIDLLREAFDRFHEAGSKLEERYNALLVETEALRSELAKKEEEVKRAERLAMLGTTAAAVAHEVRNPLGAIRLFTSMLKRSIESDPQKVKLIDAIERGITSIDSVVSNILVFSKNRAVLKGPVNMHVLIQERIHHFQSIEPETVTFKLTMQGNPWILGDEESLRRAFGNLLINAAQAVNHQGKISVSVESFSEAQQLKIIITDNGPGFPEELLCSIFEPFVSSKPSGTGLGLAIVHQTFAQHGGSVKAFNIESGAQIECVLPQNRKEES